MSDHYDVENMKNMVPLQTSASHIYILIITKIDREVGLEIIYIHFNKLRMYVALCKDKNVINIYLKHGFIKSKFLKYPVIHYPRNY